MLELRQRAEERGGHVSKRRGIRRFLHDGRAAEEAATAGGGRRRLGSILRRLDCGGIQVLEQLLTHIGRLQPEDGGEERDGGGERHVLLVRSLAAKHAELVARFAAARGHALAQRLGRPLILGGGAEARFGGVEQRRQRRAAGRECRGRVDNVGDHERHHHIEHISSHGIRGEPFEELIQLGAEASERRSEPFGRLAKSRLLLTRSARGEQRRVGREQRGHDVLHHRRRDVLWRAYEEAVECAEGMRAALERRREHLSLPALARQLDRLAQHPFPQPQKLAEPLLRVEPLEVEAQEGAQQQPRAVLRRLHARCARELGRQRDRLRREGVRRAMCCVRDGAHEGPGRGGMRHEPLAGLGTALSELRVLGAHAVERGIEQPGQLGREGYSERPQARTRGQPHLPSRMLDQNHQRALAMQQRIPSARGDLAQSEQQRARLLEAHEHRGLRGRLGGGGLGEELGHCGL